MIDVFRVALVIALLSLLFCYFYTYTDRRSCPPFVINTFHRHDEANLLIIHLNKRHDRITNVNNTIRAARKINLNPHVLEASVGTIPMEVQPFIDMTYHPFMRRSVLRKGEVGCLISHKRCWEFGLTYGCYVSEDDAIVHTNKLSTFMDAVRYLQSRHDAFILTGRYSTPRGFTHTDRTNCTANVSTHVIEALCPCYNANFYFANKSACRQLLKYYDPHSAMPTDDYISCICDLHPDKRWDANVKLFGMRHQIVTPMHSPSDTN